jgi:hypothetical protein
MTAIFVPTRYSRIEKRSLPVASLRDADGAHVHCEPGAELAAVAAVRAKALACGLAPYTPKGQTAPAAPKTLGASRRIPGYVCLAINFTRPDHAQSVELASPAR